MDKPQYLKNKIIQKVSSPINTHAQILPVEQLTWENFELLCWRIIEKKGNIESYSFIFGGKGEKQEGIDILGRIKSNDTKLTCYQCKRVKKFKPKDVESAVKKFLTGDLKNKSKEFVLCTVNDSNTLLIKEYEKQRKLLSKEKINFFVWDRIKISSMLKEYPDLVHDFFDKPWMKVFLGNSITRDFYKNYTNLKVIDNITKTIYKQPDNYIKRNILKAGEKEDLYSFANDKYQTLLQTINEFNQIILLSEAANGKTTELNNLAYLVSNQTSDLFPFKFSLKNYTNENIQDLIPPKYNKIPYKNILFILDGFDEIPTQHRQYFTKKINSFVYKNPETKIVISCRENFYGNNTESTNTMLESFEIFTLLKLDWVQKENYIHNNLPAGMSEIFDKQLYSNNLYDLTSNPFYLINLLKIFNESGTLPSKRSEIFDTLIELSYTFDQIHFKPNEDLEENKLLVLNELRRISLIMELIGKQNLTEIEFQLIVSPVYHRKMLKSTGLIKKIDGNYEFIHNNFREYLCAKVLSESNFEKIKEFLFIKNKINPKRINILSFLFSILEKDDIIFKNLISNILNENLEIFVHIEGDKLSSEKRYLIFKKIVNRYKTLKTHIPYDVFDYLKLAQFAESDKSLQFVLQEISKNKLYPIKNSLIELLSNFNVAMTYETKVKNVLLKEINSKISSVIYRSLLALAKLKFNEKKFLEKILKILENNNNDYVLAGVYYLIYKSNHLDEFIDVFLKGIKISQYAWYPNETEGESRIGNERTNLVYGLENAKSIESLKKIISYFSHNPNEFSKVYFHHFEKLINSFTNAYAEDKSIFDDILQLIISLECAYVRSKELNMLYDFIKKTGNNEKAYFIVEKKLSDNITRNEILTELSAENVMHALLKKYELKKISSEYIVNYLTNLYYKNRTEYNTQYEIANKKYLNKFIIKIAKPKDYDALTQKSFEKFLIILFNKNKFVSHVKQILQRLKNKNFIYKDLNELSIKNFKEGFLKDFVINQIARDFRDFSGESSFIINYYSGLDWDIFILDTIYEYSSNGWKFDLTKSQISYIKKWCLNNLNLDFKNCLQKTGDNNYQLCNRKSIYIWYYLKLFKFTYPKKVLLDFLSFDWVQTINWVGIQYLEELLTSNDIKNRIIENLNQEKENDRALFNQIEYCKRNKISEIIKYLPDIIKNNKHDIETRNSALETYILLSNSTLELLKNIQNMDSFRWQIINKLIKDDNLNLEKDLLKIFKKSKDIEKLRAAAFLIKYQNLDSIKYIVSLIKKMNKLPNLQLYVDFSPYSYIKTKECLKYVLQMLQIAYSKSFKDDSIYSFKTIVLNIFERIAINSDEKTFLKVRDILKKFIKTNSNKNPSVNYINFTIESIEKQFYINQTKIYTIKDALNYSSDLGLKA